MDIIFSFLVWWFVSMTVLYGMVKLVVVVGNVAKRFKEDFYG